MNRKTIALPGMHDLDIRPIMPITDTPQFQRLRYTKQLENASLIFVDANHSRFAHSLGVYALTRERANNWLRDGAITPEEAHDLELFGLLHDVGHGAYSHATEALTGMSHHDVGLLRLEELSDALIACNTTVNRMKALFKAKSGPVVGVTHRPLGTDKIDYLFRDARHTSEAVRSRTGDLLNHVYLREGKLVIDRKIMYEVAMAQQDYMYMHDRVYLRRSALIAKRFFQKIVAMEMATNVDFTAERLWEMDDLGVDATLLHSRNATVKDLFAKLRYRKLPKMAITLIPKGVTTTDRIDGKPIFVREVDPKVLTAFNCFQSPAKSSVLEEKVAQCLNVSPESVLVIPVVTPERFIPDDVPVYDGATFLGLLNDLRPGNHMSLSETARGYEAVRVCVFPEHREYVAHPAFAERVIDVLMQAVS